MPVSDAIVDKAPADWPVHHAPAKSLALLASASATDAIAIQDESDF